MCTVCEPGQAQPTERPTVDLAVAVELVERHRPRLESLLRHRLGVQAGDIRPEDVLQQLPFDVQRKWAHRGKFSSEFVWLCRLTLDRLIAELRRKTHEVPWPRESSVRLAGKLFSPHTTPCAAALREERRQFIHEAIAQLGEKDRLVVTLRHFEGLSFHEVGEALGTTANAATVRHNRALTKIRELWLARFGEE
jgi:RNA polymerase sigma factor (sigma-70 family)